MSSLPKKITLSASRVKVLQTCSWLYQCQYVMKLPKSTNQGASRGTICHLVLECFLNPRHKKHFDSIWESQDVGANKAVDRLIRKHAKILNLNEDDIQMIFQMTLLGMSLNFFFTGHKKLQAEEEFAIERDKFKITGFIDKSAMFEDGTAKVVDYKTSKAKFSDDELEGNIQALMYSLAYKIKYNVIPEINFLFLRFPKKPIQIFKKPTSEELEGFEGYLEYLADYLKDFDLSKAKSDYAKNNPDRRWLCGYNKSPDAIKKNGELMWGCSYKFAFDYFAIVNSKDEVIKTAYTKEELKPKEGEKIVEKHYEGCPAWKRESSKGFKGFF